MSPVCDLRSSSKMECSEWNSSDHLSLCRHQPRSARLVRTRVWNSSLEIGSIITGHLDLTSQNILSLNLSRLICFTKTVKRTYSNWAPSLLSRLPGLFFHHPLSQLIHHSRLIQKWCKVEMWGCITQPHHTQPSKRTQTHSEISVYTSNVPQCSILFFCPSTLSDCCL